MGGFFFLVSDLHVVRNVTYLLILTIWKHREGQGAYSPEKSTQWG